MCLQLLASYIFLVISIYVFTSLREEFGQLIAYNIFFIKLRVYLALVKLWNATRKVN